MNQDQALSTESASKQKSGLQQWWEVFWSRWMMVLPYNALLALQKVVLIDRHVRRIQPDTKAMETASNAEPGAHVDHV